jgi:hypothetical protein
VNKRKSGPTSLYEVESRGADERPAEARKEDTDVVRMPANPSPGS